MPSSSRLAQRPSQVSRVSGIPTDWNRSDYNKARLAESALFDAVEARQDRARAAGVRVTDEAMAMERAGAHPVLVEGREDNLKVTTPADLALADYLLSRRT